ncbi:MAG: metallophosphoesterase family protein, partial [bacterium]
MRILHTADWHLGKKLGRIDRRSEFEQALDELVAIARAQKVDLVVVSGDLLDRVMPPLDWLALALDTLVRLADAAGHVVAIAGNHDSPPLFELLAPLLRPRGIVLAPRVARPERGGVVTVPSRDGAESASVALLPFLQEAEVVDFMASSEEWFKGYETKVRLLARALCAAIEPETVGIFAGHFFVAGAELGGGERRIHIGPQYAATAHAIPGSVQYAALGHVHRPQEVPGAAVRTRYAGSLLQLDFSERTHSKEVVIVEASVGRPPTIDTIPLASGRRLIRIEDTLEGLQSRAEELTGAYLDVRVKTGGPVFGLADQVRTLLPGAVMVQATWERPPAEPARAPASDRSFAELYAEFHASARGHGAG